MNQIVRETPYYSRAVPSEWNGLLTIAQTELAGNADPSQSTPDNIETMRSALTPFSDERVEVNRYFGVGLALCGLAKALRQPDVRQRLIQQAGRSLGTSWRRPIISGRENETEQDTTVVNRAFGLLVNASINDMTPGARLVTDALVIENDIRRMRHMDSDPEIIIQVIESLRANGALYNRPTADLLNQNVTSGTLALFYKAAGIKGKGIGTQPVTPNRTPIKNDTVALDRAVPVTIEPITDQDLRSMNLQKAAFRIATLRLDEAAEAFEEYLAVDPEGQVFVRRDLITPKQELGLQTPHSNHA